MKKFMDKNFLLENKFSQKLYFDYVEDCPIIDFHSHLNPQEIAEDKTWDNITQIWLYGDHYKWRAMRSNGIDEKFITGDSSDEEKFLAFARTMPKLLRNPMYHWCHLELSRYFGIDDILSEKTAEKIWDKTKKILGKNFSAVKCLEKSRVEVACTTDDPNSDLAFHKATRKHKKFKVCPTFRPDKLFLIDDKKAFLGYIFDLEKSSGIKIKSYDDLISAIKNRHNFFNTMGCRASDYGLETVFYAKENSQKKLNDIFKDIISRVGKVSIEDGEKFKSSVLKECCAMDYDAGWVTQLHIGPMRNNNSIMYDRLGADAGFDSIGESNYAKNLSKHLDELNSRGKLGKTILYNINPKDNEMLGTMLGNFQDSLCEGKIQLGSGWWFLDNHVYMRKQIDALSSLSLLSRFVGMLTDSRSFLSYTRHEYFRRILCQLLGDEMMRGYIPEDFDLVGNMVADISYNNSKKYFGF